MFTRLAKFRRVGLRHIVPVPNCVMHSNDNLPGFRRPAATGKHRSPTPVLACRWFNRNGRLECRWQAEPAGDAPIGDVDEHGAMGRASGRSPMQPRGRIALAG
jgi:hypothetical protein